MQNWQPRNPVERRLMLAHDDWLGFAKDAAARLMIWQTDEADAHLVKLYFQTQEEMSSAVIGLRSDFVDGVHYPRALTAELTGFYDSRREASIAKGMRADWQAPPDAGTDPTLHFLMVVNSLMRHHPDIFPAMVLVLTPAQVSDHAAMERWLDVLLSFSAASPQFTERLRFVMPRIGDGPPPAALGQRHPDAVRTVRGQYAMSGVPRELLAASGERGPAGEFRRLFVQLGETISRDDVEGMEELRARALQIAGREGWFDQCVVVHLVAAAGWLRRRDYGRALAGYREASENGRRAVGAGHDAGHKLVANGLFGEASVHLMRKDFAMAACCYEQAAASATAAKDAILTVEAWRLSAVCWEKAGGRELALEAGFNALDAGLMIDASLRVNSNLRLVVEWMVKQIGGFDRRRSELSDKVNALLGER
ncbi:hypothetical protein J2794_006332 [Paraburkholderia terricola]|uniref:hypothetical protein n=1 Tax=Paraburkholderia terricola TaxID=169427 RepID=UPI00285D65C1|nr:hypothetical protein [Paraburkholderia terricola]MDR6450192.1 hypothetical protein [Paraburkholderia terricola]